MSPRHWMFAGCVAVVVAALAFLRPAPVAATVAAMPTVAKKPAKPAPARKAVRPAKKTAKLRAVDESGRLIPGYASAVARVRPGVDLTKPTLPPGKHFE